MTSPDTYRDQVSESLRTMTSITLETVEQTVAGRDPDGVKLDLAGRSNVPPAMHASEIADSLMLLRVSREYPDAVAGAFNQRQIALCDFVSGARDWSMVEGVAQGPGGMTVQVYNDPSRDPAAPRIGFLCNEHIDGGDVRLDIGDAISAGAARLDRHLSATQEATQENSEALAR